MTLLGDLKQNREARHHLCRMVSRGVEVFCLMQGVGL